MMEMTGSLVLKGISKSFPGVRALESVDLELVPGEIHALCGENGAGKSTLMKILGGHYRPDAGGSITFGGKPLTLRNPLDAKRQGILLVHQEISLVPDLSVAENIFLGSLPTGAFGRVDNRSLQRNAREVLDTFGFDLDPAQPVGKLSIAMQQMIEIARAAAFSASVVIFDEPTASLTDKEAAALFNVIHKLRERNVAIVYISHRMREIFELSDRVTVLRDGRVRGTLRTADTSEEEVTRLMIGRSLEGYFARPRSEPREEILRVEGLTAEKVFRQISFSVHAGEIVGLYGLVGAGRSEVAETIFGVRKAKAGKIFWQGREVAITHSGDAIRLGIGMVPESRKEQGLVLGMGALQNMALGKLSSLSRFGFIKRSLETQLFEKFRKLLSISVARPREEVSRLSGGNQQKVVIGKSLSINPKLLILDEPTRGIDVGSKADIHELIVQLAAEGMAVLVISSEMPEIMGISHRILTMYNGQITNCIEADDVTEENLIMSVTRSSPNKAPAEREMPEITGAIA